MDPIRVLRPHVLHADDVLPYLKEVDDAGCYTNHGPQERRLRAEFADALGARPIDEVSLYASGTAALIGIIRDLGLPAGSKCLVPAWTFVGSACAIAQAGLDPVFVDVDPETWAVSPQLIQEMADTRNAQAALVVSPFGGAVDYDALVTTSSSSGIPILVDAAASFDFVQLLARRRPTLPIPIMVSLHATKLLNSIEGGLIVRSDADRSRRMIAWSNFGIFDQDPVNVIGTNAKLSEIHAVYGRCSLANWNGLRKHLLELMAYYRDIVATAVPHAICAPNVGQGLVSSTFNVVLPRSCAPVAAALAEQGIETRRWWRTGVHRYPAFRRFAPKSLPVTDDLADRTIGLPFHAAVTKSQVERIVEAVAAALELSSAEFP